MTNRRALPLVLLAAVMQATGCGFGAPLEGTWEVVFAPERPPGVVRASLVYNLKTGDSIEFGPGGRITSGSDSFTYSEIDNSRIEIQLAGGGTEVATFELGGDHLALRLQDDDGDPTLLRRTTE